MATTGGMIAAVCWVPLGAAKSVPLVAEPPPDEYVESLNDAYDPELQSRGSEESDGDAESDEGDLPDDGGDEIDGKKGRGNNPALATALAAAKALGNPDPTDYLADGLAELDMDHYDDEDDNDVQLFSSGRLGGAFYQDNQEDPYLAGQEDDDDEEIEDVTIRPSDLLILTARTEDDVSHLEVWVYETEGKEDLEDNNMYVHHDIMLPAFPLSLAWLDCGLGGNDKGNFVAIGTMEPGIEIWDLDVIDDVEPTTVLGGYMQGKPASNKGNKSKKKGKRKKEVKLKEGSHADAVLGLAWNREFRNVLASGSADNSVKIWDIVTQKCERTIQPHTGKVQAVAWNFKEPTVLLSGSFDHTVALVDMRTAASQAIRWAVQSDVESLAWDPHAAHLFMVSLEDGTVQCHDVRIGGSTESQGSSFTVFTIHAHERAVCSISYNPVAPNLLATSSTDKMVKLWDTTNNQPSCIASTNPKVGAIFSSAFCNDAPFLLAVGGSKGNLHVWDTMNNSEVKRRFGSVGGQSG